MEVPGANQHTDADKAGYLTKLSSRSFPYIPQWKRRYCVLTKAKLYYYEKEDSKQGDKSSGVINLEYFDQVAEAGPKDCKKATNVFVITSQDRSFFDPGRHLFSADTLPDMKDWIRKLQTALDQIRNNNRPANSTSTSAKEGGKRRKEEVLEIKENNTLTSASKERKKKKEDSHRQRKTARVGASEEAVAPGVMEGVAEHPRSPPAKGIQLPGLAVPQGIQLPGMSAPKKVEVKEPQKEAMEVDDEDGLPTAGPTLTCVTKRRVRGPSGRRAPQNRRTQIAAATQKRASSLTALEFQELNDTRSESSQGLGSPSRDSEGIQGSSGDLQSPERDLEPIAEVVTFDDIDNELFFNKERVGGGETDDVGGEQKVTKRSSSSKVNFEDQALRKSKSRSRNGTLFGTKLSRFRETVVSFKRSRFDTKESTVSGHPDEADSSRWCTIL